ncbi:DNA polymerase I [Jonesia quinghaiensis]|uniref:DNA polymerase I n=1 Tax=Jonesia quinghaiensis TaxID=262806 RepID=UPI000687B049|nr:DNA polymerase I [Jonesia quinghaiensis]
MAYRAFFALPADKFITTSGAYTNAVHGFISMLATLITNEKPTHVGVAFDAGSHTFRTDVFPEYKGTRDATPEPFKGQVSLIKEVLTAMNIRFLEKDMFEADDILATWSTDARSQGMEVLLCSGDRDSLQLVNEDVTVLYPVKGVSELKRYTPDAVEEKYGVRPEQYPDLAALVGETSDNIPGVPGVGPKTAAKWINQFGSLAQILDGAEGIKGKVGESLRAHVEQVRKNRDINRLLTDVELDIMPKELAAQPWDRAAMHEIFDVLEFRTLRERLFALMPSGETQAPDHHSQADVDVLTSVTEGLHEWLSKNTEPIGLEVQGKGLPAQGSAWSIALSATASQAVVLRLDELSDEDTVALRDWLQDASRPKIVHGFKHTWHSLVPFSAGVHGVVFDTELAAYLAFPDQRSYALEDLAIRYANRDVNPSPVQEQGSLDLGLDLDDAARGLGYRASVLSDVAHKLREELTSRQVLELYTTMELPLARVLVDMESAGVAMDHEHLRSLDSFFAEQGEGSKAGAYEAIGREVNLGSPKQLQEVLFEQLEMPKTKKIKTGYTTDASALADLYAKTEHPFLRHLLDYRDSTKLRQTVEGLLKAITDDGRIHTTFQQTVAATGRLSSVDPNLQNIPIRTETGRRIRQAFVVGDGYETLLTADYSQIEMRIMAHLSHDEGLITAFQAGEDLHNFVGARVFGVSIDEVTPAMRSKVKAMSYGLAYGLSAFGLSKQLKISVGEASELMDEYFQRFGGVRKYLTGVVEQARLDGYTQTIMGRRRYLPDLTSDNRQRREIAERVALNAPIQGSAADIIKQAMLGVDRALREQGLSSRLLLQIHDELIVEVAPGERDAAEEILRTHMSGAMTLDVPLSVSVGAGANWHEAGH